jgi:glutamate-5-semialdehyde dehydrogenase
MDMKANDLRKIDMMTKASACSVAANKLAALGREAKDFALKRMADALDAGRSEIVEANLADIERSKAEGIAAQLIKRLRFDNDKINDAITGIESLIKLEDPVGKTLESRELDKGLELYKVSCPIGVIGVIFESRPDALIQISALCLKSGNGVLLKGGSEALETNRVLARIIDTATKEAGIPEGWIQLLETRTDVNEMLKMDEYIDLIIPRGSNDFVRYIMDNSSIPVLGHADGICHCYIDEYADLNMAVRIAVDSKTQYVAVCNAAETLLVHSAVAAKVLPEIKKEFDGRGVTIFGCEKTRGIINAEKATDESWKTEYLDYMMSVKIVDSIDEAIDHINKYGSGHTDTIVTKNMENAERFMSFVDSANVFMNCSTRFADGFRFGLGAEVGISTNKIHARGPVGLEGLLIYKYKLIGNGHIVEDYASGKCRYTHRKLDKEFKI